MRLRAFSILLFGLLALGLLAGIGDEVDRSELSRIVELLDVDPGEAFADVGAGDGRWSAALARTVGEGGTIYATEVDPMDLERIRERMRDEELSNVEVVRGTQEDAGLPEACCHGILLRRVYHHFQDPEAMQESLREALRGGGLLLVIDFETRRRWSRPAGIPPSRDGHGIDQELLVSELEAVGFELLRELDWENGDYALLFRSGGSSSSERIPEPGGDPRH